MTASTLSRGIDVRVGNDCRFDSSYEQWNAVRNKRGGESDATLQSSQRSAFLGAGICLLLAGLTTGCDIAVARDEMGVVEKALVPPPPVNQNIGFFDRIPAADCLKCHAGCTDCTDPTTGCQLVTLRHHMLLDPTSPSYRPQYSCTDCHQPDGTGLMTVIFDCQECHTLCEHHKSTPAIARHCAACHGGVVNNFDDGHYIPTYKKSIVTPHPICRVWKDAAQTTCAAGGCRTCHVASTAVTRKIADNAQTHHVCQDFTNASARCGWCHSISAANGVPTPSIEIRTCETCHGPTSLHAIEYQYDTNNGNLGFGHIGADFDCWGCHGFFDKDALPPSFGPTIPTIYCITPQLADAGVATEIVLTGQSFTNTVIETGKTYNPTIVVSVLDDGHTEAAFQVITPTSITESEIRFTATLPAGLFNIRVSKAHQSSLEVKSNGVAFFVKPRRAVTSAVLCGAPATVRVTGTGFACPTLLFVMHANRGMEGCTVGPCTGTSIVGSCPNAAVGDEVIVFGGLLPVSASLTTCP